MPRLLSWRTVDPRAPQSRGRAEPTALAVSASNGAGERPSGVATRGVDPRSSAVCLLTTVCLLIGAILYGGSVAVSEAGETERFLEGLRQRRLFLLAEFYCQEQLNDPSISESEQADWTVQWIRCLSEHAANVPANEREVLWQRAREAASRFASDHAKHPRHILVATQDALTVLAQGELARMESELGVAGVSTEEEARTRIREAIKLFTQIEDEIARQDGSPSPSPQSGELSADELTSLRQSVRYQIARALRNMGLSYPPKSADRNAAIALALEQLGEALSQVAADEPLALQMRIDQIVCCRLLGDLDQANRFVEAFPNEGVSRKIDHRLQAERIRLVLRVEGPKAAWGLVAGGKDPSGKADSPELAFARLETEIAMWQANAENEDASQWRERAVKSVKRMEQTYGPYWARRAELGLVQAGRGRDSGSLDILERTATDFYLKGRLDEALAAFDEAATVAADMGTRKQAFTLSYKAALLQQERKQFDDAAGRFRRLALSMPDYPDARTAHLHAIVNAAQLAMRDDAARAHYRVLLEEHIQQWPEGTTTDMARLWLGRFHASRHEWSLAVNALRAISPSAPHWEETVDSLARSWLAWLAELAQARSAQTKTAPTKTESAKLVATTSKIESVATDAIRYLEAVARGNSSSAGPWDPVRRQAALTAVRIRWDYTTPNLTALEEILVAALDGEPPPSPKWRAEALRMLVLVVASIPGRGADAKKAVAELEGTDVAALVSLMMQVAEKSPRSTADEDSERGAVQLALADQIWPQLGRLDEAQRQVVEWRRAEGLACMGKVDEALVLLADLASRYPNNGSIQECYGQWLLKTKTEESLKEAIVQWRRIAVRSRPRSERWFHAKYQLATALYASGEVTAAAKLIRYLQATEDLSQSGFHDAFRQLLQQCERTVSP